MPDLGRDRTGQTLQHYRILRKIGEGGMGEVYKAVDLRLNRPVALKFLSQRGRTTPDAVERLFQEALAISALNHPHIATIYDVAKHEGEPFLVLEYLPGGSLKARLRAAGPLPLAEIVSHGVQLAEALGHAHRHGIIHRDVKTANALFTEEGALKITDFGVAKVEDVESLTRPGTTAGTAAYMSPEQAQGGSVDARSDIFSLGVVLYELATGELPFAASSVAATLYNIVHQPVPDVRDRDDLPPAFGALLRRALAKDPAARYPSMGELIADLRGLPEGGQTATLTLEAAPAIRRRKRWAAAAVLAVCLAALAGWHARRPRLPEARKVAVLPFACAAGDAFCDGLADALAHSLANLWVQVAPPADVRRERVSDPREAHRRLGATLAVTGSVERRSDHVRITLRLLEGESGRQLVTESTVVAPRQLAGVQGWAANSLAGMLGVSLKAERKRLVAAASTGVSTAFDLYVQGLSALRRFDSADNVARAISLLEKAVQQDENYALAHAALAQAYGHRHAATQDAAWIERAAEHARRALALSPQLAPVHVALGAVHTTRGRHYEAVAAFQHATRLEPANANAWRGLGAAQRALGKYAEAQAAYGKAIELWPDYWAGYNQLGSFYLERGNYAEAERNYRRALELTPDNEMSLNNLAGLYAMQGRFADSAVMLEKLVARKPGARVVGNLGVMYFLLGRYTDAAAIMERGVAESPQDALLWGNLGDAYRWGAEKGRAAEAYRKAIERAERQLQINASDAQVLANLALWHAKLGERGKALSYLARAAAGPRTGKLLYKSAVVYELAGRRAAAVAALQAALESGHSVHEARQDPELTALLRDPRARQIEALRVD